MFITEQDFYADIPLQTLENIQGFGDIIDRTEEKYLKMLLGNEQYQNMLLSVWDESSDDYEKWNKFLNGERYTYNNSTILFLGAKRFLRYFCWYELIQEQSFTADTEIYKQEVTSGTRLEGLERQHKLNNVFNTGIRFYNKAYYYMADNPTYSYDTIYAAKLNYKRIFTGITL